MAYSEDHIALAAEYALGTLDAAERAQVETMMAVDSDFAAVVQAWEFRLSALNQMVGLVEPRPELWERIKAEIARAAPVAVDAPEPPGAIVLDAPPVLAADGPAVTAAEDDTATGKTTELKAERSEVVAADNTNVIQLSSKVRQLRIVANVMTAVAAMLLALIGVQIYRPELLPPPLQPKARVQTAEVKVPAGAQPSAQFVALLQKDAASPAFILTVDAGSKTYTVRRVGAAPEPGKSFELWIVSDKLQKPRSLGVIGGSDFTSRPVLSAYDADTVSRATYAVTVEPEGGSPTGQATGPIVFTGKLIQTVPPSR
ncbi:MULTISPECIES: anti-sigma factor domain-containing protein [Bradyrhizobium]|jgi:anti-sigma-K factor RskA|uniref:anti-sigma factor n=2 Tax=Nitrobacteraceae TaxID=41294 RepID=UPI0020232020|nr:anti-sigma factor [Bradyrhizobium denitrificans]MCL8484544.1 anti-sigma factor [Bradyrhizobium denitrificans]